MTYTSPDTDSVDFSLFKRGSRDNGDLNFTLDRNTVTANVETVAVDAELTDIESKGWEAYSEPELDAIDFDLDEYDSPQQDSINFDITPDEALEIEKADAEIVSAESVFNEAGGTASSALEPTTSTATSTLLSPTIASTVGVSGDITTATTTSTIAERITIEYVFAETTTASTTHSIGTISASAGVQSNLVDVGGEPTFPSTFYDAPISESRYRFAYASPENALIKFDDTGDTLWETDLDIDAESYITVDSDGNTYLLDRDEAIVSYDSSGEKRWESSHSDLRVILEVDDKENLYFADIYNSVTKLDSSDGSSGLGNTSDRLNGSVQSLVSDYNGGVYAIFRSTIGGDVGFAHIDDGDIKYQTEVDAGDGSGISGGVRESGTHNITLFAEGDLVKIDGDAWRGEEINRHKDFGTLDTEIDLKSDDDDAIYSVLENDEDYTLRKYTWDSGIEWETTIDYELDSMDVTNDCNVYVRYYDGSDGVIDKYSTSTGSHIESFVDTQIQILAAHPDYASNTDAWGDATYAGASVRSTSARSHTIESDGFASRLGGTDGVTASSSPTEGSALIGSVAMGAGTTATTTATAPTTVSTAAPSASATTASTSRFTTTGSKGINASSDVVSAHTGLFIGTARTDDVQANIISATTTPSIGHTFATSSPQSAQNTVTASVTQGDVVSSTSIEPSTTTSSAIVTPTEVESSLSLFASSVSASADPASASTDTLAIGQPESDLVATTTALDSLGSSYSSVESKRVTTDGSVFVSDVVTTADVSGTTASATGELLDVERIFIVGADGEIVSPTTTLSVGDAYSVTSETVPTTTSSTHTTPPSVSTHSDVMGVFVDTEAVPLSVDRNGYVAVAAEKKSAVATPYDALEYTPRVSRMTTRTRSTLSNTETGSNESNVSGGSNEMIVDY